jgi:cyclic pyranopterin phosphate synthase
VDRSLASATLRVSLLQQCQYDCAYCRPGSVSSATPNREHLTAAELGRLAPLFGEVGVTRVRFTGGEPLLRADLCEVVAAFRSALPDATLALTTNGQRLSGKLSALVAAGLQRATVHVDSLDPARYRALMGEGDVGEVLATVLDARSVLEEVKLNVVVQKGKNDDELGAFLDWSARHRVQVRFIELMNTGSAVAYTQQTFFSGRRILERVGPVTRLPRRAPSDPAALYRTAAGVTFGVIASDTEPFCAACNRLRLTSGGLLRGCLYQSGGIPLGAAVKCGASQAQLRFMIGAALAAKRSHHPVAAVERVPFSMADAGG